MSELAVCLPIAQTSLAAYWVVGIWIAMLGGCVGSFLNVVVYRLPAGKNLAYPGSACPACGHAIRWQHNIPVLGWLLLKGKCCDCQAPIAVRYPLVEALAAAMFLLVALCGPLAGSDDPDAASQVFNPQAWILAAYQATLLSGLLAMALIQWDHGPGINQSGVRRAYALLLVVGLTVSWVAPAVHLWPASQLEQAIGVSAHYYSAVLDAVAALLFVLLRGQIAPPPAGTGSTHASRYISHDAGCLLLAGVYLGWQGAALVAATAAVGELAERASAKGRCAAPAAWVFAAALFWTLAGPSLATRLPVLAGRSPLILLLGCAAFVVGAGFVGRWLDRKPSPAAGTSSQEK